MACQPPLQLACHPTTPCAVPLQIQASPPHRLDNQVQLHFQVTGDIHRLRIPPEVSHPARADGLWRHTCFEAFVSSPSHTDYQEFNFSPSGHWAHYRFTDERQRDAQHRSTLAPRMRTTRQPASLSLNVCLPLGGCEGRYLWGLSAVIELDDGSMSYWALHHPQPQPDFHHRGGWTLHSLIAIS